jgi:hypothetical protein
MMNDKRYWQWWLILTLIVALVYGLLGLQVAFQGDWIVQDDARQHVFWMARYLNPDLFPNDLIADYFQSIAPLGYSFLYALGAKLGIDPFVFNKLIPVALRLIITYYFFLFCREVFPIPLGCVISTLLFNHNLWLKDDIVSATPRAFLYPFLVAFLYYFTKQALIPCLITIIFLGLFYPQTVFIVSGMLILNLMKWRKFISTFKRGQSNVISRGMGLSSFDRRWRNQPLQKVSYSDEKLKSVRFNNKERYFVFIGLAVALIVMLPYAVNTSIYDPIISRSQAFNMPEFHYGGRSNFFQDSIFGYLVGKGNGVMISTSLFNPIILLSSLFFPLVIRQPKKFTLVGKITPHLDTVTKLAIASLGMFFLAHLFLFNFHLPSRYTAHSLKFVVTILAGITITVVLKYLLNKIKTNFRIKQRKILVSLIVFAIALLTYYSFFEPVSPTGYKTGSYPELYQFFQQQPKDIVIASLTKEADNLPTFTQRSILVSREYAIPYHLGYYNRFSAKVRDLITAQYSNNLQVVKQFIQQNKITFWLIEDETFTTEYLIKNSWLKQYQLEQQKAIANLQNNLTPIVAASQDTCQVFTTAKFKVIESQCLIGE